MLLWIQLRQRNLEVLKFVQTLCNLIKYGQIIEFESKNDISLSYILFLRFWYLMNPQNLLLLKLVNLV